MPEHPWFKELPLEITICDADGILLDMNDAAAEVFREDGGRALIGSNVLDCHPEPARRKLEQMMKHRQKNVYTIEKNGRKKLIYQTPWYKDGQYAGFVELSMDIPSDIPHFLRN
ncbi:MAG: PAS domain-containing protein [Anaerolineales bacterium]|nr:PAS domain-containing protein [Anaerolineales bacterium]MCX7609515.1 PAS domain-containing protein [Anaerolineales bacterium]MDW8226189.1 PAS domain-containing protein [Anaerolineales bacterium]